jgi:hypothetical protein
MYLGHRNEQWHLLIVTERYLANSCAFQCIAFGREDLITNSPLGFRVLGQLPEGERESGRGSGVYEKAVRCALVSAGA